jgi:hypothetical protein
VREVAEVQVRRGFWRSSAGSSTWVWDGRWDFAQGSFNLMAGSHELPRELTEVCDEARGWEK